MLGAYPEEVAVRGEHELGGGFRRVDQRLFDEHVGVWTAVSGVMTQYMWTRKMRGLRVSFHGAPQWGHTARSVASLLDEMGPIDAYADGIVAYTRACFGRFVDRFGTRALRRPFTEEERAEFMGYFEAVPVAC